MSKVVPVAIAGIAVALGDPTAASADTVSLAPARDTTLYSESGALSNGAGQHLFAGTNARGDQRVALLAFDLAAAIAPGSTITDMQLTLHVSRALSGPLEVSVHRASADWGEAGSDASQQEGAGAPAQRDDATWSYRFYDSETWTNPGGDYVAAPLASIEITDAGAFHTWPLAAMVSSGHAQAWLDAPESNFGLLLRPVGGGPAKRFDSRESIDPPLRPALVITFDPPAEAVGACCEASGACGFVLDADQASACLGSYQGAGTSCAPNPCPQPTGACCLADAVMTCEELDAAACAAQDGAYAGDLSACTSVSCPAVLPPFVDPLPLPAVAQPTSGNAGEQAEYTMAMREVQLEVHRDLPPSTLWGFSDGNQTSVPGPTIEAMTDRPVTVTWQNDLRDSASGELRDSHVLPVDTCVHGASSGPPRTVVHLHGGHVPARFDGFPEEAYPPGEQRVYAYPNRQRAATLWYHDHALGITRLNVYMGLAGLYIIRDPSEAALNLPAGEYEIPLVLTDRSFRADGSLIYPAPWQEHYFGNSLLVNGKVSPYLTVARGKYRFRVLNAANARTFRLSLDNGGSFQVLGSDGGLLNTPLTASAITLAAAERADIVIDFADYPEGTEIVLRNDAPAPFPGQPGVGVLPDVLKFIVSAESGHTDALPAALDPVPPVLESSAVVSRDFVLSAAPGSSCGGRSWLINGLHWSDVTEFPVLGTTEVWRFLNSSGVAHPMHLHLEFFQVLDRQQFELQGDDVVPIGSPEPLRPEERGWKDTVSVGPGEMVRVITTFRDFTGTFVYHCHILEHEDHEMMRQFVTVTACGDGTLGMPDESCDDGNGENADRCPDGEGGSCQPAYCGDGFVWNRDGGGEVCDDAGESASCDSDCSEAECGDGTVNRTAGEECDPGDDPAARCDDDCHVPTDAAGEPDAGGPNAGGPDAGVSDAAEPAEPSDATSGDGDAGPAVVHESDSGGCGCRIVPARQSPWALLPALLLLWRRSSRRRPLTRG